MTLIEALDKATHRQVLRRSSIDIDHFFHIEQTETTKYLHIAFEMVQYLLKEDLEATDWEVA